PLIEDPMRGIDAFYARQAPDGTLPLFLGEPNQNRVQIPIFSWAEWQYYLHVGDRERIIRVLPILDRYYDAVKRLCGTLRGPYTMGFATNGMSNRPSGTRLIDLTAQQAMNAYLLTRMAQIAGEKKLLEKYEHEHAFLRAAINRLMWRDEDGFYCDLIREEQPINHWTIGAYWTLLAQVAEDKQVDGLVRALKDSNNFNTPHRVPTLGKYSIDYSPYGDFWRGSVYPPMNYMVIKGLDQVGHRDLALKIAQNHLLAIYLNYINSGTLYESYHPSTLYHPSNRSRVDFVGWTGLSPIALLIENIIGIEVDAPSRLVRWALHRSDRHGVENLRWGPDYGFRTDLIAEERPEKDKKWRIRVASGADFTLELCADGKCKRFAIKAETPQEIVFP
ncbi:hypothetical protein JW992_05275, partial [candidate division KSB1 bacterium]|nr:hypothetical protein [candidate division KSB1 bacterium]